MTTNPHIDTPEKLNRAVERPAVSSSAVEGIVVRPKKNKPAKKTA